MTIKPKAIKNPKNNIKLKNSIIANTPFYINYTKNILNNK